MNSQMVALAEDDMSWFLIAVDRKKNVFILDYAPGWSDFDIETHWDDTFETDAPQHLAPGCYRWSGFKIGWWAEDEAINAKGGEFEPFVLRARAQESRDVE